MNGHAAPFAVFPGGAPGRSGADPGVDVQELWFTLSRRPWASLVLVPADVGTSVGYIANALADVGTRLLQTPITSIVADSMDYASARILSEMQPRLDERLSWPNAMETEWTTLPAQHEPEPASPGAPAQPERRLATPLMGRVIIAIQPIVEQPLGVSVAHAADAVVLCVELGVTRLKSARRTLELVRPERVLGAFLVR
jgi:hypothetical protein